MLYFDFINPYIVYAFFVLLTAFTIHLLFTKQEWIKTHKNTIFIVLTILLLWTQYVRYVDLIFFNEEFSFGAHLPFYMCRVSAVVLLYYVITKDKHVETFLFYWGSLGLAGILYPNGPIDNIANLSEIFYIDHFLLTLIPIYLVIYEGFRPSIKGMVQILGLMFGILLLFIPINIAMDSDYFYLRDQSIFGILFPGQSSIVFALAHTLAASLFFYGYYALFKNFDPKVSE